MESNEKKCPQCAEIVKSEAKICRYCSHSFENVVAPNTSSSKMPNKSKVRGKGCLIILGIFVSLGIIGSLSGPVEQTTPSSKLAASKNQEKPDAKAPEGAPSIGLFGPQANAARNAQQYLDMTGFSRRGLIEQLSSDAGNGYSVADATAAVDSLTVDWNEQAARSAKQYLDMTGFSCSGLIEQLSSDAGSKYTRAQARYGAEKAGAC